MKESKESYADSIVDVSLMEIVRYLWTNRRPIIGISIAIAVILSAYAIVFKRPSYKSESIIHVSLPDDLSGSSGRMMGFFYEEREIQDLMFLVEHMFESKQFRRQLLADAEASADRAVVDFLSSLSSELSREDRADLILSFMFITRMKDQNALVVGARSRKPDLSAGLARIASHALVKANYENTLFRIRAVKDFLSRQADSARRELLQLEGEYAMLQTGERGLAAVEFTVGGGRDTLEARSKRRALKQQIDATSHLIAEFRTELSKHMDFIRGGRPSQLYLAQMQRKIELLKYQKEMSQQGRDPASMEGAGAQAALNQALIEFDRILKDRGDLPVSLNPWDQVQQIEKQIAELTAKRSQLEGEFSAINSQLAGHTQEVRSLANHLQKLTEIRRELELKQRLFADLQAKYQEAQIQEAGQKNNLRIVAEPEVNGRPEGMGLVRRHIAAAVFGMAVALTLFTLRYLLIPTVRGREDLSRVGLKVLGEVPYFYGAKKLKHHAPLDQSGPPEPKPLLVKDAPASQEATAIRSIRIRLERELGILEDRSMGRVITMCSANTKEGKSFTAANLALAMTVIDRNVCVVDLDYQDPDVELYFPDFKEESVIPELSNEKVTFYKRVINLHGHRGSLTIIRTSRVDGNLSDLIEGPSFAYFVEQLRIAYDVIFIDCPPVRTHVESTVTSRFSDAMLMVTNQRKTFRDELKASSIRIREIYDGPIYGVLNFKFDDIKTA